MTDGLKRALTTAACLLLVAVCSCVPPPATQILLELDGDLDEPDPDGSRRIDGVRVRVLQVLSRDLGASAAGDPECGEDGVEVLRNGFNVVQRLCRTYSLGPGGELERLEDLTLGVLPFPAGSAPDAGVITVGLEAIGLSGENEEVRVFAHTRFRPGEMVRVTLSLTRFCVGVSCDLGESCRTRGCLDPDT